ncbi:MAG: PilN domain-containing protein [Blastocatellia bacterium]
MIKVNLLNSVTERQGGAVSAVDRKVGSAGSRLLLISLAVGFLLAAVVGWDVISTQMAKTEAQRQLEEQKQIAAELEVVMKEQKELEAKIQNIDTRIAAIKKLRDEQKGPVAVLEAMRERITMVPGLYLQSIEQTGDMVIIKGNSPDESAVTQFGRSLEFSNGLFSNLNIETQRQEVVNQLASVPAGGGEAPKVNVVNFTIKTAYTPSKAAGINTALPTTASAGSTSANQPAGAVQVAKN